MIVAFMLLVVWPVAAGALALMIGRMIHRADAEQRRRTTYRAPR